MTHLCDVCSIFQNRTSHQEKNTRAVRDITKVESSSSLLVHLQANGKNLLAHDWISGCYDAICLTLGVSHSHEQDFQRSGHYQTYKETSAGQETFFGENLVC